ncbi:hypothetical protein [Corynebacterium comes]|uniref:Bacterial transcription activator, effector binding domain n=1 Tax=Corynebacterium comes TaxID=2675218 RepID=A0A6B8W1K8_9CORY|nr:hypothetical protein [Corynebacterium comes]QGU04816.1 Bacterial transcription activator, effector binding domain [Corynebacterium comes]
MTRERIITVPAHTLVASRETIPADNMQGYFDRAFTRSIEAIQSVGASPAGPARAYYFSPLTDVVDLAGGFPLAEEYVEAVEAAFPDLVHRIPEFRVITGRHRGPYDQLGVTWQELIEHIRDLGQQTGPVFWEEYITMPTPDADPADMITDLYATLV